MALLHSDAAGNAAVNAVVDLLDVAAPGNISWTTSGDAALCETTLANPAFGAAATKSATLGGVPLTSTGATAGTVAKAKFRDGNDLLVFTGTVATSGADVNLSGVVLGNGETITISAGTYSVV
jgi:hypothetical protein